jgi:hypothetical protein
MKPYINYKTPQELCYEAQKVASRRGVKLVARPWNLHKPEETDWWLVPSGDWPAYQHGKYFFRFGPDNKEILCGYYIEKGLDKEKAAGIYRKPLLMDKAWFWNSFVADVKNNNIKAEIKKVSRDNQISVEFIIDGGPILEQDTDCISESLSNEWDEYLFKLQTESEDLIVKKLKDKNYLSELQEISNLAELFKAIPALSQKQLLWIDTFICIRLCVRDEGSKPGDNNIESIWGADKIWERFLSHFLKWVS